MSVHAYAYECTDLRSLAPKDGNNFIASADKQQLTCTIGPWPKYMMGRQGNEYSSVQSHLFPQRKAGCDGERQTQSFGQQRPRSQERVQDVTIENLAVRLAAWIWKEERLHIRL